MNVYADTRLPICFGPTVLHAQNSRIYRDGVVWYKDKHPVCFVYTSYKCGESEADFPNDIVPFVVFKVIVNNV